MKKILLACVCALMVSFSSPLLSYESLDYIPSVLPRDAVLDEDGNLVYEENTGDIEARSVYMKAGMWTLVAGLLIRFHPFALGNDLVEILRDNIHTNGFLEGMRIDLYSPGDGNPDKNSMVLLCLGLGVFYIGDKTIRSWYDAYSTYIQQRMQMRQE